MRRTFLWISICAAIIAMGELAAGRYVRVPCLRMREEIQYINQAASGGDWQAALDAHAAMQDEWEKYRDIWMVFTDHEEIERADLLLERARTHLELEQAREFFPDIRELDHMLAHIIERFIPAWYNIF